MILANNAKYENCSSYQLFLVATFLQITLNLGSYSVKNEDAIWCLQTQLDIFANCFFIDVRIPELNRNYFKN